MAPESQPLRRRIRQISPLERKEEANAFLQLFCQETGASRSYQQRRKAEIRKELSRHGFYRHSSEELAFGAKIAWRNHARCIGRLFWESLEVADCRSLEAPEQIASRVNDHMRTALSDGRIKSIISVFAPIEKDRLPSYIESGQITQYAGHQTEAGEVIGDRQNVETTRIAKSMGWEPPDGEGMFDLLPFMIRNKDDQRSLHTVQSESIKEIAIAHPSHPTLADVGLKWYAVPCVSNMVLTIGGIDYPCAPFNGFYMCTEIASRNFADKQRYNLLPTIAAALDLSTDERVDPFWRDTALTELNRAVSYSFRRDNITMVDHHRASDQFMEFHQREQAMGRRVAADWRWIVPPQASAATDTFHLRMRNFSPVPNYYTSRASDGRNLMPYYGDLYRSRWAVNVDRVLRRMKIWKRTAW